MGHYIEADGIKPLPAIVQPILEYHIPQSAKSLRRLLGMINYYCRFIPKCSSMLKPFTSLLQSHPKQVVLPPPALDSFHAGKTAIANATLLFHHNPDPHSELSLRTDASQAAAGAVLQQTSNRIPRLLAFFFGSYNPLRYRTFRPQTARSLFVHQTIPVFFWRQTVCNLYGSKTLNTCPPK